MKMKTKPASIQAAPEWPRYLDFIRRKDEEYGKRFSAADLALRFIPYYNSGQRIRVKLGICGSILTGTVGVTTGFRPCFILLRSTRSTGSPWLLTRHDTILGVMIKDKYRVLEGMDI